MEDNSNVSTTDVSMEDSGKEDMSTKLDVNPGERAGDSLSTSTHISKKPALKKKKHGHSNGNGDSEENGHADILAAIQDLAKSCEVLKNTKQEIENLKKENRILREGVAECKRYSWRWALKLHGLKEEANEDVRRLVITVIGKVTPGLQEYLEEGIDIAHRVGPKKQDGPQTPHRSVIILFALLRIRDAVWKSAKGSRFLCDKKLRLTEALSPEDRIAREKLWPLVKKAREEGKKAYFLGPLALIDGIKINYADID
ncbi:hypothetical protein F2P79_025226 [Pimephales promelas]|nr:hypothetical protein F2P79_025226 [Pimephales promelas]